MAQKWQKWQITRKVKDLELRVTLCTIINMDIPIILSPRTSLYDLQKSRYRFFTYTRPRPNWAWPLWAMPTRESLGKFFGDYLDTNKHFPIEKQNIAILPDFCEY